MKCPLCGAPLKQKSGSFGTFWGCSDYPNCNFKVTISGRSKEEVEKEIERLSKAHDFLKEQHNPSNCERCKNDKKAEDFYNSLFHFLEDKGYLSKKQFNSIKGYIWSNDNEDVRESYQFPPKEELTFEEEAQLRKNNLWE